MSFWICVFKINVKTRMCFQSYAPKISETRMCFLSWRDGFLETRMCFFLCFHVFPKTTKSRVLSWDVHRLTGSSPGQQIFQKENARKMPHSALKIVATPGWWSKNEETIVCLLWLARFAFAECKKYVSPKKSPKRWIGANLEKKNAGKKLWKL